MVDRPIRVSAESGFDAEGEGLDPRNRAQGAGRPDDEAHAARVADSQEATAQAAAAVRGEQAPETYSYTAADVPGTADKVIEFLRAAANDADRDAREAVVRDVEDSREGGPRKTVTDELGS